MKKIKNLMLLLVFLMSITLGSKAWAIQYCDYSMTASGRTVTISMEQPTTNNYKITIKSAVAMTGIHDGWYMNISGVGNVQVKNYAVLSGDAKTITITFTSTTTPTLYTQIHVLFPPTTGADLALYPVPPSITWGSCTSTPVLTTNAATAVGSNGGTMNGNISANGGSNITSYGFYWSTTNGFANGAGTQVVVGTTNFTGAFSSDLTSLTASTSYFYKAYATNSTGTAYGAQQTLTTTSANPPPTVTTPTVTAITATSATLGANITSIGGSAITARGTSYKTASPVAATDNQLAEGSTASGVFTQSRTTFSPQTQYYYVGYATNSNGTAISPEGNFRTLSNPATAQPATFTTTAGTLSLTANWGAATFPSSGATKAGYLVIYSTGTPTLSSANGAAPAAGTGTLVNIGNTTLPTAPPLTTTISGLTGGTLYNLLIVPYTWDGTNASTYNYLTSGAKTTTGTPLAVPAAPVPPARVASDVVAVYNDAPYSISVTGLSQGGSSVSLSGNNARLYTSVGNGTTSFAATTLAASMTFLHIDIYTLNANAAQVKVELSGANGGMVSGNFATPNGTWTSLNIPVSTFAGIGGFNSVSFIGIQPYAGAGSFYLDNIYFWKPAPELVDAVITDFTDITKVFGDTPFQLTASSTNTATKVYSSSNPLVATISGDMVTITGVGTSTITLNQAATSTHNAVNTSILLTVTPAPLSTAAPTPPARNPWDVISLYSDAYTPHSALACQNQATTSDVQLEGNDTKKMENLNIEIFTFSAANLTAMTTLHMDVYSEDCDAMNLWLLNNGDKAAQFTITSHSSWNSIDIPLSTYSSQGLNLNGVFFMKFESLNGAGKTVYVDNIYFYRPATTQPPTLTDFTIPTKAYNDPDFTITPPNSNSTGAFTYTSSNTDVATIVNGDQIHIIAGGTSTITATQEPDGGSYGTASITAQLTVTFAPPAASPVPPARTPDRVISMFTGNPSVYTNAIAPASAAWSGATMTEIPNGDNSALQLDNFGFLGLIDQTETRFDVSGMSHLHIDIYLNEPLNSNPELSRVNIYLLANGDYLYQASNLTAGWNSLSIPMSNFSAADLTQAWGLKLEGINAPTQIYIDNVYFSNECYTYYADADHDGFGNPADTQTVCDGSGAPAGYVADNTDCDDNQIQYADIDNDGFGSNTVVACGVTNNSDCNDNELQYADLDGDGFGGSTVVACGVSNHDDCDDGTVRYADNDADGFGSLVKVACDGVTNHDDCDDNTVRYADNDNDGYGSLVKVACGGSTNNTDCDDTKSTVHPGAVEIGYNLIDDDCDGQIDEGFPPKVTEITGVQCNTNLVAIDSQLYADIVAGAQGYQWRITTMSGPNTGQVQFLNTTLRVMKLTQLASYAYNTAYKVEVAVYFTGYLQPYTTSNCTVTTPAITTSLISCGQTLSTMSDVIYANNVLAAAGYRFRITDGTSTQTIDRSVREFRMNLITAFQVKFNKTYSVEVAVKNTDGTYLPYGSPCLVNTPVFPTTSIQDSQCEYAAPTLNTPIYANSYPGAIAYGFNLSGNNFGAEGVEVIKTTRAFKLGDFTGLLPGATYNLRVRLIFNYNDPAGLYGKTCTVTVPGAARMAKLPFDAKAYPNPFADSFNIDVTTSLHETIAVKVYDMTGRLLESKSAASEEMETLTIGDRFPSGVYNVIVSQGDEVKTLRVIKR